MSDREANSPDIRPPASRHVAAPKATGRGAARRPLKKSVGGGWWRAGAAFCIASAASLTTSSCLVAGLMAIMALTAGVLRGGDWRAG
jgi:hypothetical protein